MTSTARRKVASFSAVLLLAATAMVPPSQAQIRITPSVNPAADAVRQGVRELGRTIMFPKLKINTARVAAVNAVVVSPDGQWMATGSSNGKLVLWDLEQGRELRKIQAHAGETLAIAWNRDSNRLITGGADGIVRVWRLDSGAPVAALSGHAGSVRAVALSPDGSRAVTGSDDGTVRVWDVAASSEATRVDAGAPVSAVAVNADAATIFAGDADGSVHVLDLATGQAQGDLDIGDGGVRSLALDEAGRILAVGTAGETLQIWNLASGKRSKRLSPFDGSVESVAMSADGRMIAAGGDDRTVRVFDANTGKELQEYTGHGDAVTSVAFAADGNHLLSASRDGTSRIWDRPSGAPVADIISSDSGWTVVTADGLFDGTEVSSDVVGWEVDTETWELAQFTETHYEPALLTRALDGSLKGVKAGMSLKDDGVAAPPVVEISEPRTGISVDDSTLTVALSAVDQGGGIGEIRIFHNGKRVDDSGARLAKFSTGDSDRQVKTAQIELLPGENRIEAMALSNDNVEGKPTSVTVTLTAAEAQSTLHLLTVGVNKYRNPAMNLNYGVADARGLTDFFSGAKIPFFKDIDVEGLFDEEATRDAIVSRLASFQSLPSQDIVMVYLAGHGDTIEDEWYFLPHEIAYPEKEEEVKKYGISSTMLKDLIAQMGAQKVLVLVDACKSGAALMASRGLEERKVIRRLARSTGTHIVAAAGKDQFATEVKELGHGVFTYALLEGLRGQADGSPNDGVVTVRELVSFIENELPEISQQYKSQPQFPVVDSRGQDFPLAGLSAGQ
ncbi:MAG: hypothetical protein CMM50_04265 [Rhodospirillaceae bacterium]|nr:hypothetical protein [Rhodospirillaceae bacterium]